MSNPHPTHRISTHPTDAFAAFLPLHTVGRVVGNVCTCPRPATIGSIHGLLARRFLASFPLEPLQVALSLFCSVSSIYTSCAAPAPLSQPYSSLPLAASDLKVRCSKMEKPAYARDHHPCPLLSVARTKGWMLATLTLLPKFHDFTSELSAQSVLLSPLRVFPLPTSPYRLRSACSLHAPRHLPPSLPPPQSLTRCSWQLLTSSSPPLSSPSPHTHTLAQRHTQLRQQEGGGTSSVGMWWLAWRGTCASASKRNSRP